ncbi:type II secretion system F family protein [Desulfoplanes formicivorans]|uniref:General secretion pathway protein GspF n=1 Tax=Desulfoplanes formicivorans TaxID=1592317 RepID=A0A194AFV8_9BACT|nr:type II secretion system F family protein [Desulfoplanes formicivorans]GAU08967.1 general secretion pathway protein GspF [Desulfoplanes formicivorans]
MKYTYKAITDVGSTITGTLEAESVDAANALLSEKGYIPTRVVTDSGSSELWERLQTRLTKIKPQELILFTKQFRTMFKAGVSIMEIFRTMEAQTENRRLKQIIADIGENVKSGTSLADAFARHPRVFSPLYCNMLKAGEASGALPEVLNRLIYLLEHEHKVKSDIKSALQYPTIVLIALGVAFFVLLTFVIPKFVGIFKASHIDLPVPTLICMYLYQFISTYWYICLGGVVALILGLRYYFRTPQGRLVRDRVLLKIPIVGPVFTKSAMSRFASIFAILQASGVTALDSLDILSLTIGNAAISKEFDKIKELLKEGKGISGPLSQARFFTPMVVNMVAIGEESGNLDEMLQEVSNHYDDEVTYAVSQMSTNLGPILIVGLAAVVGFFALAIFLPMWDLTKMVH